MIFVTETEIVYCAVRTGYTQLTLTLSFKIFLYVNFADHVLDFSYTCN